MCFVKIKGWVSAKFEQEFFCINFGRDHLDVTKAYELHLIPSFRPKVSCDFITISISPWPSNKVTNHLHISGQNILFLMHLLRAQENTTLAIFSPNIQEFTIAFGQGACPNTMLIWRASVNIVPIITIFLYSLKLSWLLIITIRKPSTLRMHEHTSQSSPTLFSCINFPV